MLLFLVFIYKLTMLNYFQFNLITFISKNKKKVSIKVKDNSQPLYLLFLYSRAFILKC